MHKKGGAVWHSLPCVLLLLIIYSFGTISSLYPR